MNQGRIIQFAGSLRAPWQYRHWDRWFLVVVFLIAAAIYRDYGLGWDTKAQALYGEAILNYFLSGFRDQSAVSAVGDLKFYGGLFELPSALLARLFGLGIFDIRGLLTALCGVATLPPLIALARRIGSERLAFFSAIALTLTPPFVGHAFINSKDIPLACATAWAVLAIVRLAADHDLSWRAFLLLGGCLGMVLGIRVGALYILVFLVAAVGFSLVLRRSKRLSWTQAAPLAGRFLVALAIVWGLVLVAWPYAQEGPFGHLFQAWETAANFPRIYPVLFSGQTLQSNSLPPLYLATYLVLSTPPTLLVLGVIGLVIALVAVVQHVDEVRVVTIFTVLFWVGFPLGYVVVARPSLYDGMRHFLFVLPALALLTGIGAESVAAAVEYRWKRWAAHVVAATLFVTALPPLIQWHPYEYAYLNFLAGDRATLQDRYETDYWATSYRAAAEWLNARQRESRTPLQVGVAANGLSADCLAHFLDPRIVWAPSMDIVGHQPLPPNLNYYVATVRYGFDKNFSGSPVVWEERRDGVVLAVIRGR